MSYVFSLGNHFPLPFGEVINVIGPYPLSLSDIFLNDYVIYGLSNGSKISSPFAEAEAMGIENIFSIADPHSSIQFTSVSGNKPLGSGVSPMIMVELWPTEL